MSLRVGNLHNQSSELQLSADRSRKLSRTLIATAGAAYLAWWFTVEAFLPGSFNPLGSRLFVVAVCWFFYAATFLSSRAFRHAALWLALCLWLITIHYFYLFYYNQADIDWVVGSYITVTAVSACFQSERQLLSYSSLVLLLSIAISVQDRVLLRTVFLPGMVTILGFAYLGLRSRLRWLGRSQETLNRLKGIFDSVFEGIVIHDGGTVVEVNESFAASFGYLVDEAVGRKVIDFVRPQDRELVLAQIKSKSEDPYVVLGLRKDLSSVPIEIRAKNHSIGSKTLRLVAVSDITDRIKNEENRVLYETSQRAIAMRDEFLSIASHELKTPLTNIKLQTQMALRALRRGDKTIFEPGNVTQFIEQTDRHADRLARLIDEMLDVSKISSGKMTLDQEAFDLTQLMGELASAFDASLRRSGSTLQVDMPSACTVHADRFRIEQVISNLLSNAIKYGNAAPIRIQIERSPTEVSISVEDQGLGIEPADLQRIFQRFERAVSARKISGLGLGLYIANDIVQAHHGRIDVWSKPHTGSRFTVFLPLSTDERQA